MFAAGSRIDYDIKTYRYHRKGGTDKSAKIKVAVGSVAGAVIPSLIFAKKQNVRFYNVKYGLKEMLVTSSSAIAGGLAAGLVFDRKENRKQKINEGVFQFMNSTIPALLTAGIYSVSDKFKVLKNKGFKIAGTLVAVLGGMQLAARMANFINDPYDKVPDRKVSIKDSVANIDDAVGVLVLAKVPLVEKLHLEKVLPAVYSLCGYRTGTSN